MVVQGSFYFGVYKYARTGSLYDWMVVFKVTLGASYKSQSVIEAIDDADKKAPIFLSRKETYDYFASVWSQTGVNKKLAAGILQVMIPAGTHPTHADTTGYENMLYSNIQCLIMQGDNFNDEDKLSLISDMRQFNICGNNDTSEFGLY